MHESHVLEFLPSMVEYVPVGQSMQSVSRLELQALHPEMLLYFPEPHMTHGPPTGPQYPGVHEQLDWFQERGWLNEPPGHCARMPP